MSTRERELTVTTAKKRGWTKFLWFFAALALALSAGGMTGILGAYYVNNSRAAAEVAGLATYRPSTVTKVYADDGETVIAQFALQKRYPLKEKDIPKNVENAILAIEDARFYKHSGIDMWRIGGAVYNRVTKGSFEGASTLTQQVARGLFLTRKQTLERKINEQLMSLQIERFYTKRQILELYYNNFFLGANSYGFEAAARTYFGKPSKDLTLEEAATLAAIPKSPVDYSPTSNPTKALERRNLVLDQMAKHEYITQEQAQAAKAKPLKLADTAIYQTNAARSSAMDYPVEEIRKYLEEKYTTRVAQGGLEVYSTVNVDAQEKATEVVRKQLRAYDKTRGWRSSYLMVPGKDENTPPTPKEIEAFKHPDWYGDEFDKGDFVKGLIMNVDAAKNEALVRFGRYKTVVTAKDMGWGKKQPKDEFKPGMLAEFEIKEFNPDTKTIKVELTQVPEVQAAMMTENAKNGEIAAMVGGYNFQTSKFNNATQGLRQTGSSFKPYIYTAAVEWGMTPDSIVSGAPIKKGNWQPHNYDGSTSHGNVPLKIALAKSYNIAAVHLLEQVGIQTGSQMVRRFGITEPMAPYLPSALGATEVPLNEMVSAYSAFPNKGVRVEPHLIRKVVNADGNVLEKFEGTTYKVTSEYVAGTMVELMRGVVKPGGTATGAQAAGQLLAGKTGTVNDHTDVWFIGYTPTYVTGVWMGNPLRKESLGNNMTGGHGAVPYFTAFMNQFMKGKPKEQFYDAPPMPNDIKELFDQRQREENEKNEEASLDGMRVNVGGGGSGRSSSSRSSRRSVSLRDDAAGSDETDSSTPKMEQTTVPKSHSDEADKGGDKPEPPKTVATPKPAAAPAKKPETTGGNEPRPRIAEPPKKKGKKGDDDN